MVQWETAAAKQVPACVHSAQDDDNLSCAHQVLLHGP